MGVPSFREEKLPPIRRRPVVARGVALQARSGSQPTGFMRVGLVLEATSAAGGALACGAGRGLEGAVPASRTAFPGSAGEGAGAAPSAEARHVLVGTNGASVAR
jgi:hypothetical protein